MFEQLVINFPPVVPVVESLYCTGLTYDIIILYHYQNTSPYVPITHHVLSPDPLILLLANSTSNRSFPSSVKATDV